ncbi:Peptide methionine sulfoxide reductase MsrA [Candidatus Ornithobacterium hominis]|nr:Peptide methionine sulfoxide reductase MsrA [Candidatus Ornithobacterium hominis]
MTLYSCQSQTKKTKINMDNSNKNYEIATLAGGCFWCIEAAFDELKGVVEVQSGYAGGSVKNPTYKQVCTGETGHAEVVQIRYNPSVISYAQLLDVFWVLHDPTTLNRQGNDVGTQYRSAIFYHNDEQKKIAEKSMAQSEERGDYSAKYVTEIVPLNDNFYPAEDYHSDYFVNNPENPYCGAVIAPKIKKFHQKFHDWLKPEFQ